MHFQDPTVRDQGKQGGQCVEMSGDSKPRGATKGTLFASKLTPMGGDSAQAPTYGRTGTPCLWAIPGDSSHRVLSLPPRQLGSRQQTALGRGHCDSHYSTCRNALRRRERVTRSGRGGTVATPSNQVPFQCSYCQGYGLFRGTSV